MPKAEKCQKVGFPAFWHFLRNNFKGNFGIGDVCSIGEKIELTVLEKHHIGQILWIRQAANRYAVVADIIIQLCNQAQIIRLGSMGGFKLREFIPIQSE